MKTLITNVLSMSLLFVAAHSRTTLHEDVSEGTKSIEVAPRIVHPLNAFAVPERAARTKQAAPRFHTHASPVWVCAPRLLQGVPGHVGRAEYGSVEECHWQEV